MQLHIDNRAGESLLPDCTRIEWVSENDSTASILRFSLPVQAGVTLREGYIVSLEHGGEVLFTGYIFSAQRTDRLLSAVCYDQIRYLDYKNTAVYEQMTASGMLRKIAGEVGLTLGTVEETGVVISRAVDNKKLIDVLKEALEQTFQASGQRFFLLDEGGKLHLVQQNSLQREVVLGVDKRIISYQVATAITGASNIVTYYQKDKKQGVYNVTEKRDAGAVAAWGALRYAKLADEKLTSGQLSAMASQTLKALCKSSRSISLKAVGDCGCRAGVSLSVQIEGVASGRMTVVSARHLWEGAEYTMDLEVLEG